MKTSSFLVNSFILLMFAFCLTIPAVADDVPWSSQTYTAFASAQIWEMQELNDPSSFIPWLINNDEENGPPLPIFAEATNQFNVVSAYASSEITSSAMNIEAYNYWNSDC